MNRRSFFAGLIGGVAMTVAGAGLGAGERVVQAEEFDTGEWDLVEHWRWRDGPADGFRVVSAPPRSSGEWLPELWVEI